MYAIVNIKTGQVAFYKVLEKLCHFSLQNMLPCTRFRTTKRSVGGGADRDMLLPPNLFMGREISLAFDVECYDPRRPNEGINLKKSDKTGLRWNPSRGGGIRAQSLPSGPVNLLLCPCRSRYRLLFKVVGGTSL